MDDTFCPTYVLQACLRYFSQKANAICDQGWKLHRIVKYTTSNYDDQALLLLTTASFSIAIALALKLYIKRQRRRNFTQRVRNGHVWVIGSSQGLGSEMVRLLHDEEHVRKLTISSRNTAKLESLKSSLSSSGNSQMVHVLPFDVRQGDNDAIQSIIPRDVDVIIVNAGINQNDEPFPWLDIERIDAIIDTNLRGAVRLVHFVLPRMIERGSPATICVVSSLAAYRGVPGASVYGATKAALSSFCQSLSIELRALNIPINILCVHPGFIDTPAIQSLDHAKPFIISASRAARIIIDEILFRPYSHEMGFPAVMEYLVMPFASMVPTEIYNTVLSTVFKRRDLTTGPEETSRGVQIKHF